MKRVLFGLSVLLALADCTKLDLEKGIRDGAQEAVDWMADVPDGAMLSRLCIPGAHDAASAGITDWTLWTRTQDLDLAGLWNAGVRAFDLRPAYKDGVMGIYHDKYSANITFQEAMDALSLALDLHPSETCIIIMRHEVEADAASPEWHAHMAEYLTPYREKIVSYHNGITIGEMRGKFLVLSRNVYLNGPIGGQINSWSSSTVLLQQQSATVQGENSVTWPLWVQDHYNPKGADDKWEQVQRMFDLAAECEEEPYPLVINHTSGYLGDLPDYRSNARNINARAAQYVLSNSATAGIVMMDFAGVDRSGGKDVGGRTLVEALIESCRK